MSKSNILFLNKSHDLKPIDMKYEVNMNTKLNLVIRNNCLESVHSILEIGIRKYFIPISTLIFDMKSDNVSCSSSLG